MSVQPCIIVHGGAFRIPEHLQSAMLAGVKAAASAGWDALQSGSSALDAVEAACRTMESNPVFDAGIGSALNEIGEVEMDAIIVDGDTLKFGSVAAVRNLEHPISLARRVMTDTEHVMLVGDGANRFAAQLGIPELPMDQLTTEEARADYVRVRDLKQKQLFGASVEQWFGHDTTGAVVIDSQGRIAAGTTTGGITYKRVGRVGDSPLIGCGAIADSAIGGVSVTGHGESIARVQLASRINREMEMGQTPSDACRIALRIMSERTKGHGGAIALNAKGEMGFGFTTPYMAWAVMDAKDGLRGSTGDVAE
eukprot:TRINITY_DN9803_c0_g1_i1.p1 TRINITY_DN9803_c0_g1~~TRINITY_DN9803_c0_g1_i1.p1  ORF type:complete len:320 (-),score=72.65 TRINITY_DN9803_c0_g1_i1:52-978(-)